jgi:NDP-sugar pyrophosphorylase family protein
MRHFDYGLEVLKGSALENWPPGTRFDVAQVYHQLIEQRQLAGYEVQDRFYEIDSPAGLAETDAYLCQRKENVA